MRLVKVCLYLLYGRSTPDVIKGSVMQLAIARLLGSTNSATKCIAAPRGTESGSEVDYACDMYKELSKLCQKMGHQAEAISLLTHL